MKPPASWCWVTPIHSTKDTYRVIKHIIEVELHQSHEHAVLHFRSDAGTEMKNKKMDHLLRRHGIARELTCTETSYQNGKAERYIGVLFAMLRTLLHESRMPQSFWGEAVCAAAYVGNRLPLTSHKDGLSPFQLRHKKPPDLSHLRPFGSGCSVILPKRLHRGKHLPRSRTGVMVGYGYVRGQKGYRVYVPEMRSILTSVNVTFTDLYQSVRSRRRAKRGMYTSDQEVSEMLRDFDNKNRLPVPIEGGRQPASAVQSIENLSQPEEEDEEASTDTDEGEVQCVNLEHLSAPQRAEPAPKDDTPDEGANYNLDDNPLLSTPERAPTHSSTAHRTRTNSLTNSCPNNQNSRSTWVGGNTCRPSVP